ncbi:MAG: thioredoxin-disulfide reductase [Clostridia bacterium]|nr:thioredoxin-disulfide reductase [Clostridia bacterium]
MAEKNYEAIILGGGPAGYTAALYCTRAGLKTLVVEKFSAGGQMTQTQMIDNYPGFDEGVDGFTLGFKMQNGAHRFGAETVQAEVLSVELTGNPKTVETSAGTFFADAVVIATGAEHRHLGLPEEESLIGKGVGYCAACDGMFYKGRTVAVVGGGNSAAADVLLLSKICEKVYLIHRRDSLRATKVYHEPLMQAENVEFVWNGQVSEILADGRVKAVKIENKVDGGVREIPVDGVFISIGRVPETRLFQGQVALDDAGYIIADESTCTNLPGVFAAGDVRTKAVRQIVTAAADGATASYFVEKYLASRN